LENNMTEILLFAIIILVVLFDRLSFNLNKGAKEYKLIGDDSKTASWKDFNYLQLVLISIFLLLIISLFFNLSFLSDIIVDLTQSIIVYEEVAFYLLIFLSSVWFVLRFHFISFSLKKVIAREFFNLLFVLLLLGLGWTIFHTKNLNYSNRYTYFETHYVSSPEDLNCWVQKWMNRSCWRRGPMDSFSEFLNVHPQFEIVSESQYLNTVYVPDSNYPSILMFIELLDLPAVSYNYKIEKQELHVYGRGLFINGLILFYLVKFILASFIWSRKTLAE